MQYLINRSQWRNVFFYNIVLVLVMSYDVYNVLYFYLFYKYDHLKKRSCCFIYIHYIVIFKCDAFHQSKKNTVPQNNFSSTV